MRNWNSHVVAADLPLWSETAGVEYDGIEIVGTTPRISVISVSRSIFELNNTYRFGVDY
jgi:hypothetical protein